MKKNKVMSANEAPKSKFVYPDKLYARTKDNKTLDVSYAPQTLEAVEYTRTDAFIEKACEWIREFNNHHYIMRYSDSCEPPLSEVTEWFKNYMKKE